MRTFRLLLTAAALSTALLAQQAFSPAWFVRGELPSLPPAVVVGGGEVLVEAIINENGALIRPVLLRSTPPFSEMVLDAIRGWKFAPALSVRPDGTVGPVESGILIAGVFRPPTLIGPTLGDPPRDLRNASPNVPYPVSLISPPYPPQALMGSVILFEVLLDEAGRIRNARALLSDPGFDGAARAALLQWKFRPGSFRGRPAASTAYILFGFSPPVVSSVR